MNKFILTFSALIMLFSSAAAQVKSPGAGREISIKYISQDYIYIDAGSADGLAPGDSLSIVKDDSVEIAVLVISFCAEHSSSCQIVSQTESINLSHKTLIKFKALAQDSPKPITPELSDTSQKLISEPPLKNKPTKFAEISGRLSAQIYSYNDQNTSNLDFTQPTMRLNFKAANILNSPLSLSVKVRSRQNLRSRSYSSEISEDQWRTNLYELAVEFERESLPFSAKLGRIIPDRISGVGYIDGIYSQYKFNKVLALGAFAGTQPHWMTSNFQSRLSKYGGSLLFSAGEFRRYRIESSLAYILEQNNSVVSRQMIYLQNTYGLGNRLNIYQSAEIDINTGWRKDKAGSSLALSNFYATLRYQLLASLNARLSYDNRKNYWTYEIQNLDENLFDDNIRMGLRGELAFRLQSNLYITPSLGYRKIDGLNQSSYSYGLNIRKTGFGRLNLALSISYSGFNSSTSDGQNLSLSLSKSFAQGHNLQIGYGLYDYRYSASNENRLSQNIRSGFYLFLPYRIFLNSNYQYNFGDDLKGNSILAEIGYRF